MASPPLDDPIFDRSVVYVIDHNDEGAIGVVINRPLADPDLEPISRWSESLTEPPVVFNGGPVDPSALIALGVTTAPLTQRLKVLFRWLIECGQSTLPATLRSSPLTLPASEFSADMQAGPLVNSTQKSMPGAGSSWLQKPMMSLGINPQTSGVGSSIVNHHRSSGLQTLRVMSA